MLKGRSNKIPVAAKSALLLFALLGSSILAMSMAGLFPIKIGGEPSENLLSQTKEDAKSEVLPLVSLSPKQRASQLEEIASRGSSVDRHRARYLLASDAIKQNQGALALKWLENLESDYPLLAPQVALKRAQAYTLMDEKAKAEAAWKNLLENYADEPVAAEALYVLGKSNPEYWEQAIAKFPAYPRTLEIVRQKLNQNPSQFPLLLLLAKYTPDTPGTGSIRNRLVQEYAAQLKPEDWAAIAYGYWITGVYRQAGEAYTKAPVSPRNAYRAARGLHLGGKREQARVAYQKLISQFPDAQETGLGLRHLASLSPSKDALVYLDQVVSKFPDEAPEALLAKAKILEALGSSKSAAQARQSVLTQYPSSEVAAEYRWDVAWKKATAGKLEEAWQWAQPITTDSPDSQLAAEAAFWIGRWANQLGRQREGKQSFEHVLASYPESYYAWRSAQFLGWDVGDFTTVRDLVPNVVKPAGRPLPPAGSDTLKELYLLGQDLDAWTTWQVELENRAESTVAEQFTDGLMRLGIGDHLNGINQIWHLSRRETPQEQAQWQALRQEPAYWHALFPLPFKEQIANWSQQRQLNPLLVTGLIRQESRFEPKIRSVAGATGLMQVMPGTGKWVAQQIQLKDYNLEDPSDNIRLGTWYLDHTHQEYNNNSLLAVASYNAGPGNVAKWIRKYGFTDPDTFIEVIPFPETKGYVEVVFGNYWNYLRLYDPRIAELLEQYSKSGPPVPSSK
ncbi:transglycosylase SLT domain-containing protein [Lyngbya aestuarii]|uniref:transglycosylase SLT domain-containing protein n=1 Tax=Lyngbya aestuarii TaxID=118322 RepID=UPI00403D61B2